MAQIFTVTCPSCRGAFPVHPELWGAGYDLLCPFCAAMFPQEASPLIVTGNGEKRPGSAYGVAGAAAAPAPAVAPPAPSPADHAESM
jgi:hypothetical protein